MELQELYPVGSVVSTVREIVSVGGVLEIGSKLEVIFVDGLRILVTEGWNNSFWVTEEDIIPNFADEDEGETTDDVEEEEPPSQQQPTSTTRRGRRGIGRGRSGRRGIGRIGRRGIGRGRPSQNLGVNILPAPSSSRRDNVAIAKQTVKIAGVKLVANESYPLILDGRKSIMVEIGGKRVFLDRRLFRFSEGLDLSRSPINVPVVHNPFSAEPAAVQSNQQQPRSSQSRVVRRGGRQRRRGGRQRRRGGRGRGLDMSSIESWVFRVKKQKHKVDILRGEVRSSRVMTEFYKKERDKKYKRLVREVGILSDLDQGYVQPVLQEPRDAELKLEEEFKKMKSERDQFLQEKKRLEDELRRISSEQQNNDDEDPLVCQICYENKIGVCFECGHTCCEDCVLRIMSSNPRCWYCRKDLSGYTKIFFS